MAACHQLIASKVFIESTGGPRYMREKGTPKIGLHITNLHIKRPRIIVNQGIGSRKEPISGSHIRKIVVRFVGKRITIL